MLRKQPIQAERRLWDKIRNRQLGYKFKRQYGVRNYIVDFYCPEVRLVIEVDGATHSSKKEIEYDIARQQYLETLGMKVIRYTNTEIRVSMPYVLGNIKNILDKLGKG